MRKAGSVVEVAHVFRRANTFEGAGRDSFAHYLANATRERIKHALCTPMIYGTGDPASLLTQMQMRTRGGTQFLVIEAPHHQYGWHDPVSLVAEVRGLCRTMTGSIEAVKPFVLVSNLSHSREPADPRLGVGEAEGADKLKTRLAAINIPFTEFPGLDIFRTMPAWTAYLSSHLDSLQRA